MNVWPQYVGSRVPSLNRASVLTLDRTRRRFRPPARRVAARCVAFMWPHSIPLQAW